MKSVKIYEVEKIEGIDLTRYNTGDEFSTNDNIYKLHNGELKPLLVKTRAKTKTKTKTKTNQ